MHNKSLQLARFACWTACKSRFCGFATQKCSTKSQLKSCRWTRRYVGQEIKNTLLRLVWKKAKSKILKVRSLGFLCAASSKCTNSFSGLKYCGLTFWNISYAFGSCFIASTFSCVHKATIFYLPGLVASGFSAVKALNCVFGGLLRKAWVLLL